MKTGDKVEIRTFGGQEATGVIIGWLDRDSAIINLDWKYQGHIANEYFNYHIDTIIVHISMLEVL